MHIDLGGLCGHFGTKFRTKFCQFCLEGLSVPAPDALDLHAQAVVLIVQPAKKPMSTTRNVGTVDSAIVVG